MYHKLLYRQIQHHFGEKGVPENLKLFLNEINATYVHYEDGRKLMEHSIEASSEAITELNNAKRKAQEELTILFNNVDDVFFSILYPEKELLQISPSCEKIYGRKASGFIQNINLFFDAIIPEDQGKINFSQSMLSEGHSLTYEYRIQTPAGEIKWVESRIKPTLDTRGRLCRIDGVTADISKRKISEMTMRENLKKYSDLFEKMPDGLYKSTHEGRFVEVNPALVKILGYQTREELLQVDIKKDLYFDESDRDNAYHQDLEEGISVFRMKRKDGSEVWVEDRGQYVTDPAGKIVYHEGSLRDITERVRHKQAILNANTNLKLIIDRLNEAQQIARIGSWVYDIASNKREISSEFYKIFEIEPDEKMDSFEDHFKCFHPEDQELIKSKLARILTDNQEFCMESRALMKDGSEKIVKKIVKCETDTDGEIIRLHGTVQDITEQKHAQQELEKIISELKKSNAELDNFVYSVSHDLRAPLSSILGILEILWEESRDEFSREHLEMIRTSVKRLDGFIAEILDYSRNSRTSVKVEKIDLNEMVDGIKDDLKHMAGSNRNVSINSLVNDSVPFNSDKNRVRIILSNLISNAVRYQNQSIPDPMVSINIDTSDTETDIIVRDNGIGIDREQIEKIFDMFYRISENSVGSGLGLYLVKEVVEKLQGKISVESELGAGSAFHIKLPNSPN
ncbi:MAG: PAS domain-containing sensor histidine kinase [Bacteroidia bacterium]|nr:PAS domain-containing sensor histidine kinase [Bacteroidia bacterium]